MENVPFPQANDLDKIFKIISVNKEDDLADFVFMSFYLDGITDRQVSYYLSAAMYLGILDKNKAFTDTGRKLRQMDDYSKVVELIRIIISDPIIGKVYISQKVLDMTYSSEDIGELIMEAYPDYTEPIYLRRAQTVISWLKWIDMHMEK